MSIELLPLGQSCNLACAYCYEEPMRAAGNEREGAYHFDRMFAGLEAEGVGGATGFTLFGGEPLLLPRADLLRVCEWAQAKGVPLGVQTNGSLITPWHVEVFARFAINVGISIDGPEDLNDLRWVASEAATRDATRRTVTAIAALVAAGRPPSMIVTLSRMNAAPDRIGRLVSWITAWIARGVRSWNFHTLETDNATEVHQLSTAEAVAAATALMALGERHGLEFSPWGDMRRALVGDDDANVMCIWHACDPLTTDAVRGVDGQGHRKNCGRVNKDGVPARKAETAGHERQLALYLTPQDHGGCQGCRFFLACGGECPGTAEGGDWRSKTAHCATLQATFPLIEAAIIRAGGVPLSLSLDRARVEAAMVAAWMRGHSITRAQALRGGAATAVAHGDRPHVDTPHRDHTDRPAAGIQNDRAPDLVDPMRSPIAVVTP
jgi:uncharacterized protein